MFLMFLTNGKMFMLCETAYLHNCYQVTLLTNHGYTLAAKHPKNIPETSIAAANIPAVCACCGWTVCGAYIIAKELTIKKTNSLKKTNFSTNHLNCIIYLKYPDE